MWRRRWWGNGNVLCPYAFHHSIEFGNNRLGNWRVGVLAEKAVLVVLKHRLYVLGVVLDVVRGAHTAFGLQPNAQRVKEAVPVRNRVTRGAVHDRSVMRFAFSGVVVNIVMCMLQDKLWHASVFVVWRIVRNLEIFFFRVIVRQVVTTDKNLHVEGTCKCNHSHLITVISVALDVLGVRFW